MFEEWKNLVSLLRDSGIPIAQNSISGAKLNLDTNLEFNFVTDDGLESFLEIKFGKFPSVKTEQSKHIFFEDNYYRTQEINKIGQKIAFSLI